MSNEKVRVGIIGAGKNTTFKHIPGLRAIDGVSVVSVCNRSRASSELIAKTYGISQVYDNWWELISAPDTDAIVIGTWPYMHRQLTLAALAADKHVMCEARMAMNATEAQDMLAASQAKPHLVAQIVPSPMTLGVDNSIKRLIADGYLGDILSIDVRATGNGAFLDSEAPMHWRQDFDLSGYNIMSLGIWYEALMRWVGEAINVTAMGKTYVPMRRTWPEGSLKPVRIPDHLNVIADMACGAQASFYISTVSGFAGADGVSLYGSEGTLRFSGGKLYGAHKDDETLVEISIPPEEQGGWRVEQEFINAIRGKEKITHTRFEDGVKYMQFTEAVSRSMAEGRVVPLPTPQLK